MKIEIWSDFACPFCYIGKRHLEIALSKLPFANEVTFVHKSFQLNPDAVHYTEGNVHHYISQKYGIPYQQAEVMNQKIITQAASVGLTYDFEHLILNNTGKAHQLAKYAESLHLETPVVERLFKAYFEEGANLADVDTLVRLAAESGLEASATETALRSEVYAAAVLDDQEEAKRHQIQGVPFYIIDDKYSISGAQPIDSFVSVLKNIHAGAPTF